MMKKPLLLKFSIDNHSPYQGWIPLFLALSMFVWAIQLNANVDTSVSDVDGGTVDGDDYTFCVGDGEADHVSDVSVSGNMGPNSQWVVTSPYGDILGLPPTPEAVNFDPAGEGTCLIWHLSYNDGLEGLEVGNTTDDLTGEYDFSDNYVTVYRNQPEAGTLNGGPYYFTVDGTPDMVSGISLTGPRSGSNSTFVITDDLGKILGLPPSLDAVKGVNFDGAGPGTCFIYHLRYEDGLEGLAPDENLGDIYGCFDLSNAVEVVRAPAANAGEISGGPFDFCVDGTPDMVSGIATDGTGVGTNSSWVITDDQGKILGLPPTLEALEGVDFDGAGPGTCLIWYLRYEDGLEGAEMGMNADDLKGNFDLSNPIYVVRSETDAGELVGGPFYITVDGYPDRVSGISITGKRSGANSTMIITDLDGNILGIPGSISAVEGVDFDAAGPGTCLIWHLRYEDGLEGLEMGLNTNDLVGCYDLSNYIEVVRTPAANAGEITGGPFDFCVDGTPDMVSGIATDGTGVGTNSSWVITDDQGKILGLPPTLEALEGVDFDGAGPGTCLIWYLRYEDGLEGAEMGMNADDLKGNFDLSNPIYVVRSETEAGTLNGGPYYFTVDGTPDMVSGISLTGPRSGSNSTFVITDDLGKILGLPPSLDAVKGVNFDGAGPGTCFIYHLRYEDGLEGLAPDENLGDIYGCFDLSNAVEVVRAPAVNAGEITGGPFDFCVDGTPDMVSGIATDGTGIGTNSSWVITDDQGKILGLPPTLEALEGVDFDGAGPGTCLIWYLRYEDGLEGAEMGMNADDLKGNFDLSNPIYVVRSETEAGTLNGGPYYFTVDGTPDMVSDISLTGPRSGSNSTFVITDDLGKILGLPPSLDAVKGVDFDGAGPGTCFIYHLRYEDGLEGLAPDENLGDIYGCYDLSNAIEVVRSEAVMVDGGTITGGPFSFCVGDDEPDHVSGIEVSGSMGPNAQWVVTDEEGNILGLPPTPEAVDFDGAGGGLCLIWYLRYADGLEGLEGGNNVSELSGTFDFSNEIAIYRNQPEAGTLTGGPYEFIVDGEEDMVSGIALTGKRSGANSTFVITDDLGKILGLPPSLDAVMNVNFDGAGPGTCFIYHLRYEDGLEGLAPDENLGDIYGCYDLSNAVEVVRLSDTSGKGPVSLYPSPALDVINISSQSFDTDRVQMRLYDFAGNDISAKVRRIDSNDLAYDVQSLPSGIYFLSLRNSRGQAVTKKIVKR